MLSVPYTTDTAGMIGARELALMKPTAVLINIARGTIVDEAALIEALRTAGWAARRSMSSAASRWPPIVRCGTCPTCCYAAQHEHRVLRERWLTDLFCDNLRRYLNGEPLRNQVDKTRGY